MGVQPEKHVQEMLSRTTCLEPVDLNSTLTDPDALMLFKVRVKTVANTLSVKLSLRIPLIQTSTVRLFADPPVKYVLVSYDNVPTPPVQEVEIEPFPESSNPMDEFVI